MYPPRRPYVPKRKKRREVPSKKQEIIRLYQEGKTTKEIAEILNCTKQNVSLHIKKTKGLETPRQKRIIKRIKVLEDLLEKRKVKHYVYKFYHSLLEHLYKYFNLRYCVYCKQLVDKDNCTTRHKDKYSYYACLKCNATITNNHYHRTGRCKEYYPVGYGNRKWPIPENMTQKGTEKEE